MKKRRGPKCNYRYFTLYDEEELFYREFESYTELAQWLNRSRGSVISSVCRYVKGETKHIYIDHKPYTLEVTYSRYGRNRISNYDRGIV